MGSCSSSSQCNSGSASSSNNGLDLFLCLLIRWSQSDPNWERMGQGEGECGAPSGEGCQLECARWCQWCWWQISCWWVSAACLPKFSGGGQRGDTNGSPWDQMRTMVASSLGPPPLPPSPPPRSVSPAPLRRHPPRSRVLNTADAVDEPGAGLEGEDAL